MLKRATKSVFFLICLSVSFAFFGLPHARADLVGYWSFDTCDGTDNSGNGHTGTLQGDPYCMEGGAGNGLDFDGDGDYIDLGYSQDYTLSEFSICTGIMIDTDGRGMIMSKKSSYEFYMGPSYVLSGAIWIGSGHWALTADSDPLTPDEGACVCMTYGGGYMKLYIDGEEVASGEQSSTPDVPDPDTPLYIGYDFGAAAVHYLDGKLDEVSLYNHVLSPEDVGQYCSAFGPGECDCPDSDSDGVPDAWDDCADTPAGRTTDNRGCPKGTTVIIIE